MCVRACAGIFSHMASQKVQIYAIDRSRLHTKRRQMLRLKQYLCRKIRRCDYKRRKNRAKIRQ